MAYNGFDWTMYNCNTNYCNFKESCVSYFFPITLNELSVENPE